MLPFAGFVQIKVRCPHCGRDELRWRVSTSVGAQHVCPRCGRSYRITRLLPVGASKPRSR